LKKKANKFIKLLIKAVVVVVVVVVVAVVVVVVVVFVGSLNLLKLKYFLFALQFLKCIISFFYLLFTVSQYVPFQPAKHLHKNEFIELKHFPPFKHGLFWH